MGLRLENISLFLQNKTASREAAFQFNHPTDKVLRRRLPEHCWGYDADDGQYATNHHEHCSDGFGVEWTAAEQYLCTATKQQATER